MNAQTFQSPLKNKGDLFLLIKKQNLPKLQQLSQKSNKAKSPNTKNPQIEKNTIKPQSEKYLSTESISAHSKPQQQKIIRKDSQVSIVQDFNNTSMSEHKKITLDNQKSYVINISACSHNDSLEPYLSPEKHQDHSLFQPNSTIDFWPQILEKNDNFKAFFQYILDFKLMKKNSYHPYKPEVSISKNQESTKITSKRLPNSLAVKFPEKQAEKNQSKFQQIKSQVHENKQQRNRELQNSQISLVDVRISSASIDDFTPMFKNENKRLNSSPSSEMKKTKRVYFDFQNPRFSQPDCILEETNPIVQSENNVTIINRISSRILLLQELKKRIQNQQEQSRIFTHHGYFCDECKADPIVGKLYRCIQCDEYDLCQRCYKKQCDQYGKILKQYENNHKLDQNESILNLSMDYLFETRPLLKKQMSDIVEQENLSQNYSSQENLLSSSEKDNQKMDKDHVHLMQEVPRPKQIHHLNFQKILRQTNRCSLRSINEKNHKKEGQNFGQKRSLFQPSPLRQKLINSIKMNKSRLAFSERIIPLNLTSKSHRKILESKRKQIQNIRKSTQSISNHFQ